MLVLQVSEAEEMTAGGLLLTDATKENPSTGTVRAQTSLPSCSCFPLLYVESLTWCGYICTGDCRWAWEC